MDVPGEIDRASLFVSVLFSEPKIPQCAGARTGRNGRPVSVLFSEPKIPQCPVCRASTSSPPPFQCSSASRKFLNPILEQTRHSRQIVSVLFSEPKIPQCRRQPRSARAQYGFSALQRAENSSIIAGFGGADTGVGVSVLFSEPKIPQFDFAIFAPSGSAACFSALQRAENSSIPTLAPASIHISDRDDHASSFLSLPGASP